MRSQRDCVDGLPGCEVLTIPHNSNLDGGLMFQSAVELGGEIGADEAWRRARWEPLVEVMQHKGDSECLPGGDTTDEACGFEKLPYDNFRGRFPLLGAAAADSAPAVRARGAEARPRDRVEARRESVPLRDHRRAPTRTSARPAWSSERGYPGHGGAGAGAADALPVGLPDAIEFNPGGLAGALGGGELARRALRRAEAPRDLRHERHAPGRALLRRLRAAERPVRARRLRRDRATRDGVPMGGELLGAAPAAAAPRFAVSALQDPGSAAEPGHRRSSASRS